MTLGLDFENNFPDTHITTLIAKHTIKHQEGHIGQFVFRMSFSEQYLQQMAANKE